MRVSVIHPKFAETAGTIAERVAELLHAETYVLNDRGIIAAASDSTTGQLFAQVKRDAEDEYLRVPFGIEEQDGEVVVGRSFNGEDVPPRLMRVVVELVLNQATVVDQLPNQQELKNTLIHDLLHGLIRDEDSIVRQAKILGMDLTPPRAVILVDASDYIFGTEKQGAHTQSEARQQRRAQLVIGSIVSFFRLPSDTICAYIGDGEVAILKASNTKNLEAWADSDDVSGQSPTSWANLAALKRAGSALLSRLRSDTGATINVGIGRYHPGIHGLASSYEDARAALTLGRRFHGPNRVHCLDSLGVAAFIGVSDERTKVDLAAHLLSPLGDEPELVETLQVFFDEDCCPSATAHGLSIHRNTLSYRLDKIASLTGLDPRDFDDAVQFRLAFLLRSLEGELDAA